MEVDLKDEMENQNRDWDWIEIEQGVSVSTVDNGEAGKLQRPGDNQPPRPEPEPESEWIAWYRFLQELLRVGGWTVAVLLAFRFLLVPLLGAGNSPVAIILALSVGAFLIMAGLRALFCDLSNK